MAEGTACTIGTFDGIHLGHQAILGRLNREALRHRLERVAYAFAFPPRLAMQTPLKAGLLMPEGVKLRFLERFADRVVRGHFARVRETTPEDFVADVLLAELRARVVVVGEGFRFGHDRRGDVATLRSIGAVEGFSVIAVPPVMLEGEPVSSTRIRRLLIAGDVEGSTSLLGRPPFLLGSVVPGDRLGQRLGYPTANLDLERAVLRPKRGLYLAHACWPGNHGAGLLYIGERPTVGGRGERCELHLLVSPAAELYGERMEVQLLERLRDDRAFPSEESLVGQITRDVAEAKRRILNHTATPEPIAA